MQRCVSENINQVRSKTGKSKKKKNILANSTQRSVRANVCCRNRNVSTTLYAYDAVVAGVTILLRKARVRALSIRRKLFTGKTVFKVNLCCMHVYDVYFLPPPSSSSLVHPRHDGHKELPFPRSSPNLARLGAACLQVYTTRA